jgi:thioredoxin reductase
MPSRTIVVVGASTAGCRFAKAAHEAGHRVVLIDEHPQSLKDMALDAPYFYGTGLPAALASTNAVAQAYLEARPELLELLQLGVDIRPSTVVWGAFRDGENSVHIGTPKVGLVSRDGNVLLEHDVLVVAAGVRDFVPSFAGWELPGVCGAKAALAFVESYGVFEGRRVLVLGTSEIALRLARSLRSRQIDIAALVEPGAVVAAGPEAAAWLAEERIPVRFGTVIAEARGTMAVDGARLVTLSGEPAGDIGCDCIAVAVATLPNVELPAAMGCAMLFDPGLASWVPDISAQGETSRDEVFYLGPASKPDVVEAMLARISGAGRVTERAPAVPGDKAAYVRTWIEALHATGGPDVVLCQCEGVTRGAFCNLEPPGYLEKGPRRPPVPISRTGDRDAPLLHQDLLKRMTRVGMGHCQGKRCRDEAAFTLMQRFGVDAEQIRPGSYRFPLRPVDAQLLAADDETDEIRSNWQMWPYETRNA